MSLAELGLQTSGTDVVLNVTTILLLIQRLSPGDRAILFNHLGINSEEGIMDWLASHRKRTYEEQLLEFTDYRTHRLLVRWVPPFLLVIGTIGNFLCFIILMQRSMRKSSTYIYLAVLSVTDTLVLYIGLLRIWATEITGYDIRLINWVCKVINVVGYTVSDYSVWLIISVTVERYIAVCHPLQAPRMCNRRRAMLVIASLLVFLFLLNSHFFWTATVVAYVRNGEKITQCAGKRHLKTLVVDIWPWVDAFIYSFLPFAVITILNILIIRVVVIARNQRTSLQSTLVHTENRHTRQQQESSYKLTLMLLTISFTFLLTTLPVNVSLIATAFWYYNDDLQVVAKFYLVRTITELLMYTNHSINFFLYCATGQRFRQQLITLLCRKRARLSGDLQATNRSNIIETPLKKINELSNDSRKVSVNRILLKSRNGNSSKASIPNKPLTKKTCATKFTNNQFASEPSNSFPEKFASHDKHSPTLDRLVSSNSYEDYDMEMILFKDKSKSIDITS